jgi:hypothetical protein
MIRCKLISPTNLLLEHPLLLAHKDETEFVCMGRKEYEHKRVAWIRYGALIGIVGASAAVGLMSLIVSVIR